MAAYPNSFPQPMANPYQQNFNPMQMPMQNPYMDRMAQMQQYQQNFQQPQMVMPNQPQGIIGKVVNDFSEITANDVPMNGSAAFFPKADGSELQVRSWASNGTIQTVVYRPVQAEDAQGMNMPQIDLNALNEDVRALRDEISQRFDRLEKSMEAPAAKTATRGKKGEVSNDE